ncbi:MAG: Zn-binding domain-containing protein [Candidatus Neomarinimicrobiota bacterium]|nr:Zn-binding domain-containing protein [Candidatus Neomarinimicrobiota bacterium]
MVATSETSQLIDLLQSHPEVGPNLAYVQRIPPKEAVKASFPEDLPEGIISTLQSRGIEQPYFHQADCLKDSQAGKHTVVVTPAVFFFDNFPDGVGFSQQLYDLNEQLVQQMLSLIEKCKCQGVCPSCVGVPPEK